MSSGATPAPDAVIPAIDLHTVPVHPKGLADTVDNCDLGELVPTHGARGRGVEDRQVGYLRFLLAVLNWASKMVDHDREGRWDADREARRLASTATELCQRVETDASG
jgi:hypothetical protein